MTKFLDEIETCVPALRRYARALLRDIDLADDLVQDTLERALNKQKLWLPIGKLNSWLFKIMLNIYRNDLRSRKRQSHVVSIDDLANPPVTPPEQPANLLLSEVASALNKLPDEQRQVLLLVAIEGFSYAEGAGILKIPIGTFMSRLGRARSTLRQLTSESGKPTLRRVK